MEWLELYRGEALDYYGRVGLKPVLEAALARELRSAPDHRTFVVQPTDIPDRTLIAGTPRLANLRPQIGHLVIYVLGHDHRLIYRHSYAISDLLGPTLQAYVGEVLPDEAYWGFCISSPKFDEYPKIRPTPEVAGVIDVDTTTEAHASFRVRRVEEAEPPEVDPAALGLDPADLKEINVLLPAQVHAQLAHDMPLSNTMEDGGFLLGRVSRAAGVPKSYLVHVEQARMADHAGASRLQFTFTGDSFREANRALYEQPGWTMTGWFHTHLFPSTSAIGLSDTDIRLHLNTFQRPFQVAGLINYIPGEERRLRFYARSGDSLVECPYWIEDERDRYRLANAALGA